MTDLCACPEPETALKLIGWIGDLLNEQKPSGIGALSANGISSFLSGTETPSINPALFTIDRGVLSAFARISYLVESKSLLKDPTDAWSRRIRSTKTSLLLTRNVSGDFMACWLILGPSCRTGLVASPSSDCCPFSINLGCFCAGAARGAVVGEGEVCLKIIGCFVESLYPEL